MIVSRKAEIIPPEQAFFPICTVVHQPSHHGGVFPLRGIYPSGLQRQHVATAKASLVGAIGVIAAPAGEGARLQHSVWVCRWRGYADEDVHILQKAELGGHLLWHRLERRLCQGMTPRPTSHSSLNVLQSAPLPTVTASHSSYQ